MKVKNISTGTIFLNDLWAIRESPNQGRRGEARYLAPDASVYFPNTSEVLRSAAPGGTLAQWRDAGIVELEDTDTLAANGNPGDAVTLTHNWQYAPVVHVLRRVAGAPDVWADATGTYDMEHNLAFTTVTITNTTAGALTFLIRLL